MLKNYFKIAIAVLRRRKFFTFISLIGISFTLTILIVTTAFVDNVISPNYPEVNRDRSLYISGIHQRSSKKGYSMNGPASYYYMEKYVASLKTPSKVAIVSMFVPVNTYVNNKRLSLTIKYTNEAFWEVMQYQFLEGKPFSQQQIDNSERVAVISEETEKNYFGDIRPVTGRYIEADNVKYRVTGVVKNVPVTMMVSSGDLFVPYTVSKTDYRNTNLSGNYNAVILADSRSDIPNIKAEYASVVSKVKPDNKDYDLFSSSADQYLAIFTREIAGNDNDSGVATIITITIAAVLFFMLLPTLNLVNINISRIMERSAEIGVRKAFGASSMTLVYQFIVENIILTFFGSLIGIILAFIILQVINNSNFIPNLHLTINLTVLFYSLVACLAFGLLSGVYPAWRMSRLHVVNALKVQ